MKRLYKMIGGPPCVEYALRQFLPRTQIKRSLSTCPASEMFLEHLSKIEGYNAKSVLFEAAKRLGLKALIELHLPSPPLLRLTAMDPAALKRMHVLPQFDERAEAGYGLAAADIRNIDMEAFQQRGVRIGLALHSEIVRQWQQFDALICEAPYVQLPEEGVPVVIRKLAFDTVPSDSGSVEIGRFATGKYRALTQRGIHCGSIDAGVYWGMLGLSRGRRNFSMPGESDPAADLEVEVVHEQSRPYFHVTIPNSLKTAVQTLDEEDAGCEILVIDDDRQFNRLLIELFERKGYGVRGVHSIEEAALDRQRNGAVELVVCDVHLGGPRKAFTQAAQIADIARLREIFEEIPILFLTSDDSAEMQASLVRGGADAFVNKQEDCRILLAWAANLIERQKRKSELRYFDPSPGAVRCSIPWL